MNDADTPTGAPCVGGASERLLYEALRPEHAAPLADALTDPRVNAHFVEGGPRTAAELEADFARKAGGSPYPGEVWLDYAVRTIDTGSYVGRVEATVQGAHAEIAYLIGPAFWGRGYGQEAARWIERRCRDRHGVGTFWATVAPANQRSVRLLERLGYTPVEKPDEPLLTSYDDGDLVFRRCPDETKPSA